MISFGITITYDVRELFCQYQPSFELTKLRAKKIATKILGLRNIRRYSLLENENFSLIDKNGARFNLDDVIS
jgi:hypothetical protein